MKFLVEVDITMLRTYEVEAESKQQARNAVYAMIKANPYDYTHGFTRYIEHEIIDTKEVLEG